MSSNLGSSLTFVTHHADKVLLLSVTQHMLLQVLFLLKGRLAAFVLALEWTILAMDVLDVDFQFSAGGEGRRTLVAVVVLDLKVPLQVLLDVLFLEGAQSADVAFESFLL